MYMLLLVLFLCEETFATVFPPLFVRRGEGEGEGKGKGKGKCKGWG